MNVLQKIRTFWLYFIKHTLNHLTRALARRGLGPFWIVQHTGRRSGKQYETPIIVQPVDGGFIIALTYGPDVDWYKNVRAAGGCTLLRHDKAYAIHRLEALDAETGRAAFPQPERTVLRLLGISHFAQLSA